MTMYEKTLYGKELSEKFKQLNDEITQYKTPIKTDLSLLPSIMGTISESLITKKNRGNMRYYFVIVVVMLYSPRCFIGQVMSHGLRQSMSDALGIKSVTTVSHIFTTANIWLNYNKEFRNEVERLHEIVIRDLK